jgi:uncharacterized protein (DUF1778 family)
MPKVITLRLSDEEYQKISCAASGEHRPISNFITAVVMKNIAESYFVDPIEMDQIKSDKKFTAKLQRGHNEAKKLKGKLIG